MGSYRYRSLIEARNTLNSPPVVSCNTTSPGAASGAGEGLGFTSAAKGGVGFRVWGLGLDSLQLQKVRCSYFVVE